MLHDAVALTIASQGKDVTTKDVEETARELLYISFILEQDVKDGVFNKDPSSVEKVSVVTEEAKFDDDSFFL